MSAPMPASFPEPPPGIVYLRSKQDLLVRRELDAYQHLLLRAWSELDLNGVLVVRGIPTVYLREDDAELSPQDVHSIQQRFWNQGVATVLVLVDRKRTRVFSGMVPPRMLTPSQAAGTQPIDSFVEELDIAAQALRAHRADAIHAYHTFCRQVVSGQFYRKHNPEGETAAKKFDPREMVDAYLLDQLAAVRDELTRGKNKLPVETAHAFLGRLLFTCYLIDRGIVILSEGKYFPHRSWGTLQDVLSGPDGEVFERLYKRLFPQLKRDFNGSMFDDASLDDERDAVRPAHLRVVRDFFAGHDIGKNQRTLGFWAYDFSFIPVETISAIYENFLKKEGESEKRENGAYYTPRFLAEMTLDAALEGRPQLTGKRFLDASCGSGIFLVLLFNRLASEWAASHRKTAFASSPAAYRAKDEALRSVLAGLRGVDKNPTACRIACFSLYLAFLDRFTPSDIRTYIQQSETDKLPNLLRFKEGKGKRPDIPVIWEGDFFPLAEAWAAKEGERFDYAIGNPPWAGRGKKQIAQDFMAEIPRLLRSDGKAALLLPTKVFFNKTDAFQTQWLRAVTLEKVVLLADYSFILFTNALCPCLIARFNPKAPAVETHRVEYLTPKVARVDLRQGAIPIAPADRKEIPLRLLLGAAERKTATFVWKSHFWGAPPDVKLLQELITFPKLSQRVDQLSVTRGKRKRDWAAGQGCKPWSLDSTSKPDRNLRPFAEPRDKWTPNDSFVAPKRIEGQIFLPALACGSVREHFATQRYSVTELYSKPPPALFTPPLVLFNQGFSDATFFDFPVRFQHSLQSIAGPAGDADKLLFLAAYLRSRLARYFAFHTSSNIGMERDKVHLNEVLSLPFYLPGDADTISPKAENLMQQVVAKLRNFQARMTESAQKLEERLHPKSFNLQTGDEQSVEEQRKRWLTGWAANTASVQDEIEPLLCDYFGLNSQERALVEDTWRIFDQSDTPGTLDTPMPTLEAIGADAIGDYATMLGDTIREWSHEKKLALNITAGVDEILGVAVLKVEQTKVAGSFRTAPLSRELAEAVRRVEESATTSNGSLVYLRDETWWFDGPRIFIAKPALKGRWTRTAALCDCGDIYATIQLSRREPA
jgi:SAM-dependent methyltransferase